MTGAPGRSCGLAPARRFRVRSGYQLVTGRGAEARTVIHLTRCPGRAVVPLSSHRLYSADGAMQHMLTLYRHDAAHRHDAAVQ